MKLIKIKRNIIGTVVLTMGCVSAADAALESRLNGLAVYDTDLDITWLSDAGSAKGSSFSAWGSAYDDGGANDGKMSWANANAWADSLTVGGFSDWRLAGTLVPDTSCTDQFGPNTGLGCTGSEMGHLYSTEGVTKTTPGLFTNIDPSFSSIYWSSTEVDSLIAYEFVYTSGFQNTISKDSQFYGWAVRSGDVSAVPVPAAVWLFGSGLLGLVGLARRKR